MANPIDFPQHISGGSGSLNGSNVGITPAADGTNLSLWYVWKPPVVGTYFFSTRNNPTNFPTKLNVYTLSATPSTPVKFSDLTLVSYVVGGNFPNGYGYEDGAMVAFVVTDATQVYYISVDSRSSAEGNFNLSWDSFFIESLGACGGCTPTSTGLCIAGTIQIPLDDGSHPGYAITTRFGSYPSGWYVVQCCSGKVPSGVTIFIQWPPIADYLPDLIPQWTDYQAYPAGSCVNLAYAIQEVPYMAPCVVVDNTPGDTNYAYWGDVDDDFDIIDDPNWKGNYDPCGTYNPGDYVYFYGFRICLNQVLPHSPNCPGQLFWGSISLAGNYPDLGGGTTNGLMTLRTDEQTNVCTWTAFCHPGGEIAITWSTTVGPQSTLPVLILMPFDPIKDMTVKLISIQNNGYVNGTDDSDGYMYSIEVNFTNNNLNYNSGPFSIELLAKKGIESPTYTTYYAYSDFSTPCTQVGSGYLTGPTNLLQSLTASGTSTRTSICSPGVGRSEIGFYDVTFNFNSKVQDLLVADFQIRNCYGDIVGIITLTLAQAQLTASDGQILSISRCSVGTGLPVSIAPQIKNVGVIPISAVTVDLIIGQLTNFSQPGNATPCVGTLGATSFEQTFQGPFGPATYSTYHSVPAQYFTINVALQRNTTAQPTKPSFSIGLKAGNPPNQITLPSFVFLSGISLQ